MKNYKYIIFTIIIIFSFGNISYLKNENNIPISTKWLIDSVGDTGRISIESV